MPMPLKVLSVPVNLGFHVNISIIDLLFSLIRSMKFGASSLSLSVCPHLKLSSSFIIIIIVFIIIINIICAY